MNILKFFISFIFIFAIVFLNTTVEYIPDAETLKSLQAIFLSVGSALIGSTAIIFSIILFTLQVNNEKLPSGTFEKFSNDKKLFSFFRFSLIISVGITILSFLAAKYALYTIQIAIFFFGFILYLFSSSYNRALELISPSYHLKIMIESAKKNLLSWSKSPENNLNIFQNIFDCNTYAKKLIEKNDYDSSKKALKSIVVINIAYIKVTKQVFIRRNQLVSNDKFIENTLEEILESEGD